MRRGRSATEPRQAGVPAALGEAMANYGKLLDQLEAGAIDAATFRRRALGIGLVVRDDEAWILDLASERWWRYDGISLSSLRFGDGQE